MKNGQVNGLKAVGNFTVDITWVAGKATQTRIVSNKGARLVVKADKDLTKVSVRSGGKNVEVVPTETEGAYELKGIAEGATVDDRLYEARRHRCGADGQGRCCTSGLRPHRSPRQCRSARCANCRRTQSGTLMRH